MKKENKKTGLFSSFLLSFSYQVLDFNLVSIKKRWKSEISVDDIQENQRLK